VEVSDANEFTRKAAGSMREMTKKNVSIQRVPFPFMINIMERLFKKFCKLRETIHKVIIRDMDV